RVLRFDVFLARRWPRSPAEDHSGIAAVVHSGFVYSLAGSVAVEVRDFSPQHVVDSDLEGTLTPACGCGANISQWRLAESESLPFLSGIAAAQRFSDGLAVG